MREPPSQGLTFGEPDVMSYPCTGIRVRLQKCNPGRGQAGTGVGTPPTGPSLQALWFRGSFRGGWTVPPGEIDKSQSGKPGGSGQRPLRKLTKGNRGGRDDQRRGAVPGGEPEPGQPAADAARGAAAGHDRGRWLGEDGGDPGRQLPHRGPGRGVGAVDRAHGPRPGTAPAAGGRLGCRPAAGARRCGRSRPGRCGRWSGGWSGWKRAGRSGRDREGVSPIGGPS